MTTIAVSKKTGERPASIACDLQMTYAGNITMRTTTKILELKQEVSKHLFNCDKTFVGFSGNASSWGNAVSWFLDPSQKPPKFGDTVEMLALTSDGDILHSTTLKTWLPIKENFFAIGSGMPFALSALELGKTPKEAVLFASKRDAFTGMGVKEYTM